MILQQTEIFLNKYKKTQLTTEKIKLMNFKCNNPLIENYILKKCHLKI